MTVLQKRLLSGDVREECPHISGKGSCHGNGFSGKRVPEAETGRVQRLTRDAFFCTAVEIVA